MIYLFLYALGLIGHALFLAGYNVLAPPASRFTVMEMVAVSVLWPIFLPLAILGRPTKG